MTVLSQSRLPTQLIVLLEVSEGAPQRLAAALDAGTIASVIIMPARGEALNAGSVAPLVALAQKAGAAALITRDARLARTMKADGVHLPVSETLESDYAEARELISPRFVTGVDAGASRHDAMTAGEAGADYVGFSIVDEISAGRNDAQAGDADEPEAAALAKRDPREERLEQVAWWAEIFEVPCVAFDVEAIEEAESLAAAGADFIGIRIGSGVSPADVADRVRDFGKAIAIVRASIGT